MNLEILSKKVSYVLRHDSNVILDNDKSMKKRHEINGERLGLFMVILLLKYSMMLVNLQNFYIMELQKKFVGNIFKSGLISKERQYVHLSEEIDTAISVGLRRDSTPVILKINALNAFKEGDVMTNGNRIHMAGWLGDVAGLPKKYRSSMKNDDYTADLDAVNIVQVMKQSGVNFTEAALNYYYQYLELKLFKRSDKFVENIGESMIDDLLEDSIARGNTVSIAFKEHLKAHKETYIDKQEDTYWILN